MSHTKELYQKFANDVNYMCSHVSVRDDDGISFVLALSVNEIHTLEIRKVGTSYKLELWLGATAEEESVVAEHEYTDINKAFYAAKEWLKKDSI